MAAYNTLLMEINDAIKTNGQGAITGAILNTVLCSMVMTLGTGYQFKGIASPNGEPGTPDAKVFFIATTPGTYTNYGGVVVGKGISIIRWDNSWSVTSILTIDTVLSSNSENPVANQTILHALDEVAALINSTPERQLVLTSERGYYLNSSGSKVSFNAGYITNPVHVFPGDIVTVSSYANQAVTIIAKTDANGSYYTPLVIGTAPTSSAPLETVQYTATEECYLAFSALNSAPTGTIANYYIQTIVNRLDSLQTDLQNLHDEIYGIAVDTPLELTDSTGYYIGPTGNKVSFYAGHITAPILVRAGQRVTVSSYANQAVTIIAKTDANGSYYTPLVIGTAPTSSAPLETVQYTATEDCYLAFSALNSAPTATIAVVTYEGLKDKVTTMQLDLEKVQNEQIASLTNNILAAFDNIVCIGDSLTFSQVYTSASYTRQAHRPYPTIIGDICGNSAHILARPGATAKTCWDEYGSSVVSRSNPLAIIYLGTNQGLTDTLSADVVGDDPANWADNNIGCYCRFVQKCKSLGYRVLLIQCWATSGTGDANLTNTRNAIAHVATRFGCALIDCPVTHELQYHYYPDLTSYNEVHYNDLGYAWFAQQLITRTGKLDISQMKLLIPA